DSRIACASIASTPSTFPRVELPPYLIFLSDLLRGSGQGLGAVKLSVLEGCQGGGKPANAASFFYFCLRRDEDSLPCPSCSIGTQLSSASGLASIDSQRLQLCGCFHAKDRQCLVAEQADFLQDRSLIPVNVLVLKFAAAEFHDGDQSDFDALPRGSEAGEHPWHFPGVGERKNHLVHQLILTHGARHHGQRRIGRHARNEIAVVERTQGRLSHASGQYGNMVHIGIVHHGVQRCFDVAGCEFVLAVFFPKLIEVMVGHVSPHGFPEELARDRHNPYNPTPYAPLLVSALNLNQEARVKQKRDPIGDY